MIFKALVILLTTVHLVAGTVPPVWNLYPSYYRHLRRLPAGISRQIFFKADTQKKIVALTFDDGPLSRTPKLLDFLKRRKVPATFFLLAPQLSAAKAARYSDPLFEIGLHGYHHVDFRKLSPAGIRRELDRALKNFHRYGLEPRYFRPPYGMVSRTLLRELSKRRLRTILWSIDSRDWDRYRGRRYLRNILESLTPGSVILMHDQSERLGLLDRLIDGIRKRGYRVVPLRELLSYQTLIP